MKPTAAQLAPSIDPLLREYVAAVVSEAITLAISRINTKAEAAHALSIETRRICDEAHVVANAALRAASEPTPRRLGR